ncbi:MAG: hypothetical protein RLZZ587_541 [Actinomycetota bacterium]|jgi:CobQ-like glutamine amidotransferase family enzyme
MVHVVHLFPKTLGLFGDGGNVLALQKRCEWRGIPLSVTEVELGNTIPSNADVYVIGSGSSNSVRLVAEHVAELRDALTAALSRDASLLAIGAGLHVLGTHIDWADGSRSVGAGVIRGESRPLAERRVGEFIGSVDGTSVAGFINTGHHFDSDLAPHITDVMFADSRDSSEIDGVYSGTIIGTHSHGSYLPMNPAIADGIIARTTGQSLDVANKHLARADHAAAMSRESIRARLGV